MTWQRFAILDAIAAAAVLAFIWWPRRNNHEPPVPEAGRSPAANPRPPAPGQPSGDRAARGPAPGSQAPHNPLAPGTITFDKPCGCKRTVDEATRRTLFRWTCEQAPDWELWQREVDAQ